MSAEEAVVVAARLYPGLTVGELARRAGVTEADVRRAWRAGLLVVIEMDAPRYYLPEAAATLPPGSDAVVAPAPLPPREEVEPGRPPERGARMLRLGGVVTEEQARAAIASAGSIRGASRLLGVDSRVMRRWYAELNPHAPTPRCGRPAVARAQVLAAVEAHPGSTSAELVALTGASRSVVHDAARLGLLVRVHLDAPRYYLPEAAPR